MAPVPARLTWAVEVLAPRPRDRVLEVGCGNGVAAELLLSSRSNVTVTAIDRSATAIAACQKRLAPFIEEGRASVVRSELAGFVSRSEFDGAFAVNVNSFWLDARPDLEALSRLLAPGAALLLVFEPPSASKVRAIAEACSVALREHGFTRVRVKQHEGMVAVRSRLPSG